MKSQNENDIPVNQYNNLSTPSLMKRLLGELNSKYHENEDGSLYFLYQGERFWLQADQNSAWVRITDFQWYECSLNDIEEFSCMQKAINTANSQHSCTAIYAISGEENKMIAYSKCDFVMSGSIPSPDQYLAAWLADFFRLKQEVVMEFEKEKQKQKIGVE